MNKDERKVYMKQYRKDNAEYYKEYMKQYRKDNAEGHKEYNKQYYEANKERLKEQRKQYNKTPMGRASILLGTYNQSDKKANRGKGDLTAKWVVENILFKPCAHCGKEGWQIIGCNRLDNSKPHTMDNVEPCCWSCNSKLARL